MLQPRLRKNNMVFSENFLPLWHVHTPTWVVFTLATVHLQGLALLRSPTKPKGLPHHGSHCIYEGWQLLKPQIGCCVSTKAHGHRESTISHTSHHGVRSGSALSFPFRRQDAMGSVSLVVVAYLCPRSLFQSSNWLCLRPRFQHLFSHSRKPICM